MVLAKIKGKHALEISGDDENVKYLKLFPEMRFSIFSSTIETKRPQMTQAVGGGQAERESFLSPGLCSKAFRVP